MTVRKTAAARAETFDDLVEQGIASGELPATPPAPAIRVSEPPPPGTQVKVEEKRTFVTTAGIGAKQTANSNRMPSTRLLLNQTPADDVPENPYSEFLEYWSEDAEQNGDLYISLVRFPDAPGLRGSPAAPAVPCEILTTLGIFPFNPTSLMQDIQLKAGGEYGSGGTFRFWACDEIGRGLSGPRVDRITFPNPPGASAASSARPGASAAEQAAARAESRVERLLEKLIEAQSVKREPTAIERAIEAAMVRNLTNTLEGKPANAPSGEDQFTALLKSAAVTDAMSIGVATRIANAFAKAEAADNPETNKAWWTYAFDVLKDNPAVMERAVGVFENLADAVAEKFAKPGEPLNPNGENPMQSNPQPMPPPREVPAGQPPINQAPAQPVPPRNPLLHAVIEYVMAPEENAPINADIELWKRAEQAAGFRWHAAKAMIKGMEFPDVLAMIIDQVPEVLPVIQNNAEATAYFEQRLRQVYDVFQTL